MRRSHFNLHCAWRYAAAAALAAVCGVAMAQLPAPTGVPAALSSSGADAKPNTEAAGVERERSRIEAERMEAERLYLAEEKTCYTKFVVNDCLNLARAKRRTVLADLRRQDISLNDAERRRKGAEAIRKLDERTSPEKLDQAAGRRAQAIQEQRIREEKAAQKAEAAASNEAAAKGRVKSRLEKEQAVAERASSRAARQSSAASAASAREQKLRDAAERRARVERREKERTKPAAMPLPPP